MVSLPLGQMLTAVGADVHPPLHYLLLWTLTHLGLSSAFWLRLPSVLLGVLAIWQVRSLGAQWLSPRAALAAGVLMTFAPFQLMYSQEARTYALLQALWLLAVLSMTRGRWGQFVIANIGLLYAHNYGLIYAAVLAPLAAGRLYVELGEPRQPWTLLRRLAWLYIPVGAAYLPWVGVLAQQMAEQRGLWWQVPTTLGGALYVLYALLWRINFPGMLANLAALLMDGLILLGLWQLWRTRERAALVLVWLIVAPLLAAVVIELVYGQPILLHRALIGSAAPLYLLIGHGLSSAPRRRLAWAMLAPLLALGSIGLGPERQRVYAGQVFISAPDVAQITYQSGDWVVHGNPATLVDCWRRCDWAQQAILPPAPGSMGVPSERFWRALGVPIWPQPTGGRVWLVWVAGPTASAAEDAAIRDLTAGAQVVWTGHSDIGAGGIWLLTSSQTAR